jgi:hypothetical protein
LNAEKFFPPAKVFPIINGWIVIRSWYH